MFSVQPDETNTKANLYETSDVFQVELKPLQLSSETPVDCKRFLDLGLTLTNSHVCWT